MDGKREGRELFLNGTGVERMVERSKERRSKGKKEECWTISAL